MDENTDDSDLTWIILGAVVGFLVLLILLGAMLVFWQRHSNNFRAFLLGIPFCRPCLMTARDSLTDLEGEEDQQNLSYTQRMANWRRSKMKKDGVVVGVKVDEEPPLGKTAGSGFRWKKKWRDRKIRSKLKRKLKHEERKKRRQAKKAEEEQESSSEASSDDDSDSDSSED